jgi:hypothetical protein
MYGKGASRHPLYALSRTPASDIPAFFKLACKPLAPKATNPALRKFDLAVQKHLYFYMKDVAGRLSEAGKRM